MECPLGKRFRELINYRKTDDSMEGDLRRDQLTWRSGGPFLQGSEERGASLPHEDRSKVQVVSDSWVAGNRKRVLYSKEGICDLEDVGLI